MPERKFDYWRGRFDGEELSIKIENQLDANLAWLKEIHKGSIPAKNNAVSNEFFQEVVDTAG